MNLNIQSRVYRVSKGSFVNNQTGEVINYAKVYILQNVKDDENDVGLDIQPVSCDVELYDDLVKFYRDNSKLNLEIELKPNNGLLKPKVVKITQLK